MYARVVFGLTLALFSAGAEAFEFTLHNLKPRAVSAFECASALDRPKLAGRRLRDEGRVVIASWNIENVHDRQGRFEVDGISPKGTYQLKAKPDQQPPLAEWKFQAKQEKLRDAAYFAGLSRKMRAHFIIAAEAESFAAAEELFNSGLLSGQYRTFLVRGNDARGIDIAFAVRADLDVDVDVETHRHATWFDTTEGKLARVFNRDVPVLIIRDGRTGSLELILIGQHTKSMRDRAGGRDPNSTNLRAAQFEASRLIVADYQERFGKNVPIVMAGDFNTDVATAAELAPLKTLLTDAFDVVGLNARTTHTYHPVDRPVEAKQLDACLVSNSVRPFVREALVLPEFDRVTKSPIGPPTSLYDRIENYPSDHRAIAVVLDGALFR